MKTTHIFRSAAIVVALLAGGTAANADGDIYTRLFEMNQMDKNKDGMVSKTEFMAMVSKVWDMQAAEMKVKGGKMSADQIKEIERVLGRTLGSRSGS